MSNRNKAKTIPNSVPDFSRLPAPLGQDTYSCLMEGVSDDSEISVWVNSDESFAFLDPLPVVDYGVYQSRVETLGLHSYKKNSDVFRRRLKKIEELLSKAESILEVGAADAAFLAVAHEQFPKASFYSVEPDLNTQNARDSMSWLRQMTCLAEAINAKLKVDLVAMFHVFEHIEKPSQFLRDVRQVIAPNGALLIEVPSLTDPLISLYESASYQQFYFQKQHPYVYTENSLGRVLAANGFIIEKTMSYQRYGIENHLQWLIASAPGGNQKFANIFRSIENTYRKCLEKSGMCDTVLVLAKPVE